MSSSSETVTALNTSTAAPTLFSVLDPPEPTAPVVFKAETTADSPLAEPPSVVTQPVSASAHARAMYVIFFMLIPSLK